MLCDKTPFTLEQTLASVDFFIDEYLFRHAVWFSDSDDCELSGHGEAVIQARKNNLYRYATMLYPYVYKKQFDLNTTDFRYDPRWSYPHFDEPEALVVAAIQLYAFWINFLGNDFLGTPYQENAAQPLNQLVIDGYLRFRIDFAWTGTFMVKGGNTTETEAPLPCLFSYGELAHITSLSNSTLRGKITNNTTTSTNIKTHSKPGEVFARRYNSKGSKAIAPYGMQLPKSLNSFFAGKIGGSVKVLFAHREIVPFIATSGSYEPTQFIAPEQEPFPDYSDSAKIYAALLLWMKRYSKTARIERLLEYIGAAGKDVDGRHGFWASMESGKAKLSLPTVALINNYMVEVEGGVNEENPWTPLLNAFHRANP